jgi:hypothetical protein
LAAVAGGIVVGLGIALVVAARVFDGTGWMK